MRPLDLKSWIWSGGNGVGGIVEFEILELGVAVLLLGIVSGRKHTSLIDFKHERKVRGNLCGVKQRLTANNFMRISYGELQCAPHENVTASLVVIWYFV